LFAPYKFFTLFEKNKKIKIEMTVLDLAREILIPVNKHGFGSGSR
jgi:hypothetical protein